MVITCWGECVCASNTLAHTPPYWAVFYRAFLALCCGKQLCSRPRAALTTRSMRPSECRPGCHFGSNWRHKRAPRLPCWPKHPCCLWIYLFPRKTPQGNHLSNSKTLISCEIYMQYKVMKRCICAVAFPLRSADLQSKTYSLVSELW